MIYYSNTSELYHHGIKGMKWGVRRYINSDGSLTPAGKARYYKDSQTGEYKKMSRKQRKQTKKEYEQKAKKAQNKYIYWRRRGNEEKAAKFVEEHIAALDVYYELPRHRKITWDKDGVPHFS